MEFGSVDSPSVGLDISCDNLNLREKEEELTWS